MIKYLTYFKCNISKNLVFRFDFFTEYLSQFITIIVKIFLWQAIIYSSGNIQMSTIITYFIIASLVSQTTDLNINLSYCIRTGELSNHLIKPVNIFIMEYIKALSDKIISFIKFIPMFILLILLFRNFFAMPIISVYGVLFLFIGFTISFSIQLLIHNLAFWMTEVSAINFILTTVFTVVSGNLIPLDLLPINIKSIFNVLPFKFYIYIPVNAFMGSIDVRNELMLGTIYIICFFDNK
ncbi:hypothetical protein CIW83_05525 [Tissierella sp. P1]|uniref:ABC transporter permease n=1 Tax=Tissierella sp. P1 TaxID=1280483 RepID=UPI000BA143D3|nr:ABC-2 family transporter protein [Tissierella sp. P1]OZV13007.1 hypothetical protein CIW83_05525 [Tissierella sp. P1]